MRKKMIALITVAVATLSLGACASTRSTGQQIDDAALTASVKARLAADPDVKANEIDVDTLNGVVRLSGIVDDSATRSEAEQVARRTDGVRSVKNELQTGHDLSTGQKLDDATITARVKTALIDDETVSARDIDVDTLDGVVTLTGIVRSEAEKAEAAKLAKKCDGVRAVTNELQVGPEDA